MQGSLNFLPLFYNCFEPLTFTLSGNTLSAQDRVSGDYCIDIVFTKI